MLMTGVAVVLGGAVQWNILLIHGPWLHNTHVIVVMFTQGGNKNITFL